MCRRCSECKGMDHHWLPNPNFALDETSQFYEPGEPTECTHICKHCDAQGEYCEACDGLGTPSGEAAGLICGACNGEGVIPISTV